MICITVAKSGSYKVNEPAAPGNPNALLNKFFKPEELLNWQQGVTIRPEDVAVDVRLAEIIQKQHAIDYKTVLQQASVVGVPNLSVDEKVIYDKLEYKAYYEKQADYWKARGFRTQTEWDAKIELTSEELKILEVGPMTPLDKDAYDILKNTLLAQGVIKSDTQLAAMRNVAMEKERQESELRKSVIAARNFSTITLHTQKTIAELCDLPPGRAEGMANPKWWVALHMKIHCERLILINGWKKDIALAASVVKHIEFFVRGTSRQL